MSEPKTVPEELLQIATSLYEAGQLEIEDSDEVALTSERILALGIASGAVMRARAEFMEK